jgi:GDP-L-fucose synthase
MKRLLITGASGFIGRNLVEAFEGRYELVTPGRFELDLGDLAAVKEYLKLKKPDVLIHCANSSDTNRNVSKRSFLAENLRMFFALESLIGDYYEKMIYFGSGAEYGKNHCLPRVEEDYFGQNIPEPGDEYGLAKYVMAKHAEKSEGIINLRLFGVFGKYEKWSRRFISNAILRALKGLPLVVRENKAFDYLWVEDLAPVVKQFIENKPRHKTYNVCTGKTCELKEIAEIVCEVLGVAKNIEVLTDGGAEYSGGNERLTSEFDIDFTDMEIAIRKLSEYYKERIDEIDENLL